jgi:ABC-type oligopeptide transport system substrate-binding subunit
MDRRSQRRRLAAVAALLGLLFVFAILALSGCNSQESNATTTVADTPAQGGNLALAIAEPVGVEPLMLVESEGTQVANALFDSLVAFDPKTSQVVPAVATEWESSKDATVWTFHLQKETTFHNGREVTAADFKYAWERLANPENESPVSYHLAAVKGFDDMQAGASEELSGVKAVDDYTLEVTLAYPFADFIYVVGHPALAPVPKEEVEKDPAAYAEMPIGNGPFQMAEPWQHDQYVKLVRFDGYYGTAAHLDGIDFKIVKDPETALLEFKAGSVDFTMFPSGQATAIAEEYGTSPDGLEVYPGQQTLLGPEVTMYFFALNTEDPVLSNVDVRRALSLAINREAIASTLFEGIRNPASTIIPDGIVGYEDDAWPYSRFDRVQAASLLEKAGYPNGEGMPEIRILVNAGGDHEDVAALMQADLQAIGVKSKIESAEMGQFFERLGSGDFQLARYSWTADYPIIDNFIAPLFQTDSGDNAGHYSNSLVDEAIITARGTIDDTERVTAYEGIVRQIGEDCPAIPIVSYRHQYVGSDRVRGLICSPMGLLNLDDCWLATQ